ncbi:MAG: hypothetical protein DME26_13260 [Verrucomicrobia bacterium]|nr:MAG: hypothetical protein DME26_13260 [Verrucomicrobiota bacterium]
MKTKINLSAAGMLLAANVFAQPIITLQPTNQIAEVGDPVSFNVIATGTEPLSYQWYFAGTEIPQIATLIPATLFLANVQPTDSGSYMVVVTNVAGSATSQVAVLTVRPAQFTRITTGPLVNDAGNSTSVAWGDYDNDGFIDLLVANTQGANNRLFHNVGGNNFIQTVAGPIVSDGGDSFGGVWGDYANDGFLDVFVANVHSSNFLYHNDGGTNFTKITSGSIVNEGERSSFSCTWGDYDRDGYLDLFVADLEGVNNLLYHNNRDGTFTKITSGPVVSEAGNSSGGVWGDYDNDGFLDLFVANTDEQNNFLYHNNGDGTFTKITDGAIVNDGGNSRDAAWGGYDNDGYLDLFVANRAFSNDFLYHNNGDGTFTRVTTGAPATDGASSVGCAWGDFDKDGFLDLAVTSGGVLSMEANRLYRNVGNSNSWIVLKLIGTVSNRAAIGAKVRLRSMLNGRMQWPLCEISAGHCRGSQNDLCVHFGLGDATNIDTVRIEWPSGTVQELRDVAVKQFLTITEPLSLQLTPKEPEGVVRFTLRARKGLTSVLETSEDLATWLPFRTNTATGLTLEFEDTDAAKFLRHFYRARLVTP